MTIDDPTPHAPRLPTDPPPPRRRGAQRAQATAGEGESSSAVSVPESPSQDPSDRPDGTTAHRAVVRSVVRAILDALPADARAMVAGLLLAWLRFVVRYAARIATIDAAERAGTSTPDAAKRARADALAIAERATDELTAGLHEAGYTAPAEAAAGAWFGCGSGDVFGRVDCEPAWVRQIAEDAQEHLAEMLASLGQPRLVRLPLDAPARVAPDPREAMVRGIVEALPPASARNALRGAVSFLRTLDGLAALAHRIDHADPSAGRREAFDAPLRAAVKVAGVLASFSGRRRSDRARRTLVAAVIGVDPVTATQMAAGDGFPTRLRSGVAVLERALRNAKAGRAAPTAPSNTARPTAAEVETHLRRHPLRPAVEDVDCPAAGAWLVRATDGRGNPCALMVELSVVDGRVEWAEAPAGLAIAVGGDDFEAFEREAPSLTNWRYYPCDAHGDVVPRCAP